MLLLMQLGKKTYEGLIDSVVDGKSLIVERYGARSNQQ